AGCGRIFEGTPEQMWGSLCRLRSLPGGTKIFPGHEYTLENLEFAASLEPENRAVQVRLESVRKMRKKNIPTVPALISEERLSNPFFRADDPLLGKAIGMESNTEIEIFAAVRKMKDRY
ncbi:MAG: hydroxyacylglutathione hydrolase, partial [Spirochaetes bacterium]|nr:hydroxyacylglutathione hydrolase [Spirochaetota bacterium]